MANSKQVLDVDIINVCKSEITMAKACAKVGLHFNTFKKRAILLGCYKPNQAGLGVKRNVSPKIPLIEILEGKHPSFQTNKLKKRLLKENIISNNCSQCGINQWLGKPLVLELDHIDGNRNNHKLENLRLLCPNCHSQTNTFRGKNTKN
jgi:hypothetical protein